MSDPHGHSHGAAVADPHAAHDDAHGHSAHGHGHGHEPEPVRTPVPPHESTPWGMILLGLAIVAAVFALGIARDWAGAIDSSAKSRLAFPSGTAQAPAR